MLNVPIRESIEKYLGHHPSLIWNNISWGKTLLLSGLRNIVGTGTSNSIFKYSWISGYGKLPNLQTLNTLDRNVSSLIKPKENGIYNKFKPRSKVMLAKLYNPSHSFPHLLKIDFTSLTLHMEPTLEVVKVDLIPLKIKHFIRRAYLDALPTSLNLYHRGIVRSPMCYRCHSHKETLAHALFGCFTVHKLKRLTCNDALYMCTDIMTIKDFYFFKIWHYRNESLHNKPTPNSSLTIQ
ncbi:hypothetical protein G4B88_002895 [Cannabis sativa]|uniref:Reverse transcriptase zinc-binding domain-containing protein n=1 Tax=Cannabis sativa TaxID=3483 RepID=A0A7J6GFT0_CANSA|nr:hypothetical protein G4B88_002895 [Cannabis sativa]